MGPNTGFFGYENQAEGMRVMFEGLKENPSMMTNIVGLNLLSGAIPGMTTPERKMKDWFDFSLLPSFDQVAKYFYFSVFGGSANVTGLTFKIFAPVPPTLRGSSGGD